MKICRIFRADGFDALPAAVQMTISNMSDLKESLPMGAEIAIYHHKFIVDRIAYEADESTLTIHTFLKAAKVPMTP